MHGQYSHCSCPQPVLSYIVPARSSHHGQQCYHRFNGNHSSGNPLHRNLAPNMDSLRAYQPFKYWIYTRHLLINWILVCGMYTSYNINNNNCTTMSQSCIYKSHWIGHYVIKHLYLFVRKGNKTSIVIKHWVGICISLSKIHWSLKNMSYFLTRADNNQAKSWTLRRQDKVNNADSTFI